MKKNLLFTLFLLLVVATAFAQRQFRFKDGKFKVVQFTDIHWDPKSPGCDTTRNTILSVLKQESPTSPYLPATSLPTIPHVRDGRP